MHSPFTRFSKDFFSVKHVGIAERHISSDFAVVLPNKIVTKFLSVFVVKDKRNSSISAEGESTENWTATCMTLSAYCLPQETLFVCSLVHVLVNVVYLLINILNCCFIYLLYVLNYE